MARLKTQGLYQIKQLLSSRNTYNKDWEGQCITNVQIMAIKHAHLISKKTMHSDQMKLFIWVVLFHGCQIHIGLNHSIQY